MPSLYQIGHYSLDWVKDFYDLAGEWWGADPQDEGTHTARVEIVSRLCGSAPLTILDLGSGGGATAAALAAAGHHVTGIEFSRPQASFSSRWLGLPRNGTLRFLEADFYTVDLPRKFDLVTYWDGFGIGTDAEQQILLKKIATEWLKRNGCLLMDVFNPFKAARDAGSERHLAPLKGVAGSVEMINRHFFDAVTNRWIDEWEPVEHPENTMAQTIRCYSPTDLELLLEGTGLRLVKIEQDGKEVEWKQQQVNREDPVLTDWSYLAFFQN
jgi:SAM-dependent methyltransferase